MAGSGAHPRGAGAHTCASSAGCAAGPAAAPPTSRPAPVTRRTSSPRCGSPAAAAERPQLCPSSEPTDPGLCVHPQAPQRSLRAGACPSASGPELVINRWPVSSAGPVQHGTRVRAPQLCQARRQARRVELQGGHSLWRPRRGTAAHTEQAGIKGLGSKLPRRSQTHFLSSHAAALYQTSQKTTQTAPLKPLLSVISINPTTGAGITEPETCASDKCW